MKKLIWAFITFWIIGNVTIFVMGHMMRTVSSAKGQVFDGFGRELVPVTFPATLVSDEPLWAGFWWQTAEVGFFLGGFGLIFWLYQFVELHNEDRQRDPGDEK